eukprot:Clim_evm5s4 gene=Clim_evmTU5s4
MAAPAGTVAQSDLQRFDEVTKEILRLSTENVEVKANVQYQKCAGINAQLQSSKKYLAKTEAEKKKLDEQLEKLGHRGPKRFGARFKKGGISGKEGEIKNEINELTEKIRNLQTEVGMHQTDLTAEEKTLQSLKGSDTKLKQLKAEEAGMLERIFRGQGGAGDAKENELEVHFLRLAPSLQAANADKQRYESARSMIQQADKCCQSAEQQMQAALRWGQMNQVGNIVNGPRNRGPGQFGMNVGKQMHIKRAKAAGAKAEQLINQARQAVPTMIAVKVESGRQMGLLLDSLLNGFVGDAIVNQQIRKGLKLLKASAREVQRALAWVQWELDNHINPAVGSLNAQYTSTKTQLDSHRRQLMEHALQNGGKTYVAAEVQAAYASSDAAGGVKTEAQKKAEEAAKLVNPVEAAAQSGDPYAYLNGGAGVSAVAGMHAPKPSTAAPGAPAPMPGQYGAPPVGAATTPSPAGYIAAQPPAGYAAPAAGAPPAYSAQPAPAGYPAGAQMGAYNMYGQPMAANAGNPFGQTFY